MAISIKSLQLGAKLKDRSGNTYIVIGQNHYASGQTTVWTENVINTMAFSASYNFLDYQTSDIHYFLNNVYPNTLSATIREHTKTTKIHYMDVISSSMNENISIDTKYFLLSSTELGNTLWEESNNKAFPFLDVMSNRRCDTSYWTRSEIEESEFCYVKYDGEHGYPTSAHSKYGVRPAFNLSHELMVEDEVENGYFRIIESIPPVIPNIPSIVGNYASDTTINYTVINEENHVLTHYFSVDSGNSWQKITPTKNGDNYSFKYIFSEIKNYPCRIKVVYETVSSVISNMFSVTINHSAPTITILGHDDLDIRFKVNCITSEISKVEMLVNGSIIYTFTENLEYNLNYSIDKTLLTETINSMQIKATSKGGLVTTRDIEVRKITHDIPPVGSRVVINDDIYTVKSAVKNGDNIILNLVEELVEDVSKGDLISILQDNIKVKCSLSNLENKTDYKDMTLAKVKTLKGDFLGYVEEKYVLEGQGRYSAIKLEMEKFTDNVEVAVKELQQMFDYLED